MTAIFAMNDYGCGVTVLSSDSPDAGEFAAHMARAAEKIGAEFALVFFSQMLLDAQDLTAALALHAPSLHYAGCSTAGEITPFGTQDGQMLAILFPSHSFKVATTMIRNISGSGLDSIAADVCAVRRLVLASSPLRLAANTFALSLIDGLSHAEEAVTSAVNWGLDGIPLVGGSAGDGSRFRDNNPDPRRRRRDRLRDHHTDSDRCSVSGIPDHQLRALGQEAGGNRIEHRQPHCL